MFQTEAFFFFLKNSHYLSLFPSWITKAACEPSEIEFLIDLQWGFFSPSTKHNMQEMTDSKLNLWAGFVGTAV